MQRLTPGSVRAALSGADGSLHGILDPRRIVRWIYGARLILVTAIFLAMVVSWRFAPVTSTLVASLALALAMAFTAASALYSEIYRKPLARTFLYLQSSFDLLLLKPETCCKAGAIEHDQTRFCFGGYIIFNIICGGCTFSLFIIFSAGKQKYAA